MSRYVQISRTINSGVNISYLLSKYFCIQLLISWYFGAKIIGAPIGCLFRTYAIGTKARLGASSPNYSISIWIISDIEVKGMVEKSTSSAKHERDRKLITCSSIKINKSYHANEARPRSLLKLQYQQDY
jgi:hypothetical protein